MKKTVIITGASRGLGLSLARIFLNRGDQVLGLSRTTKHWKSAMKGLSEASRLDLSKVDITSEAQVRNFYRKVRRMSPRVDILINAGGYGGTLIRTEETSLREFQKHLADNLIGSFLMCKYAIPFFKKQKGGLIINVSSMAGQRAVPRLAAYSASKFGVIALSQAIAKENPEGDPKCITVCPGGMSTEMRAKIFGWEDARKQQSPDFVAGIMMQVIDGTLPLPSGSDIVIRHGKVTTISTPPNS